MYVAGLGTDGDLENELVGVDRANVQRPVDSQALPPTTPAEPVSTVQPLIWLLPLVDLCIMISDKKKA
jgi:hypothetical protein